MGFIGMEHATAHTRLAKQTDVTCYRFNSFTVITLWRYICLWMTTVQFSPTSLKEGSHAVTSLPHWRIIFIKCFTVIEYKTYISTKFFP